MFKLHLYNLKEYNSKFINNLKNNNLTPPLYNKNFTTIEVLSTYEILVYTTFVKPLNIKETNELIKKMGIEEDYLNNILENSKFLKEKKIINLDYLDNNINLVIDKEGLKYIYIKFIGDKTTNTLKKFLNEFKFDVFIYENNEELSILGEKRNFFLFKEIDFYLDMFKISYGLIFYFIKNKLKFIEKYLNTNELEYLTNKNINIQHSVREMMDTKLKKRWRSNKKMHILNIFNIIVLEKEQIYINKNKYYVFYDNEIYNIKKIFLLKRENIIKIKEKYNRSNETLYIYKNDLQRFIIKSTKSVSKTLNNNLKPVTFEDFLKGMKFNE